MSKIIDLNKYRLIVKESKTKGLDTPPLKVYACKECGLAEWHIQEDMSVSCINCSHVIFDVCSMWPLDMDYEE